MHVTGNAVVNAGSSIPEACLLWRTVLLPVSIHQREGSSQLALGMHKVHSSFALSVGSADKGCVGG